MDSVSRMNVCTVTIQSVCCDWRAHSVGCVCVIFRWHSNGLFVVHYSLPPLH